MSVPASAMAAHHRGELLFANDVVLRAIDQLAVRLAVAFSESNPLLICVMNGGLPFTAAVMQRLQFPLQLDYVHVGRYGVATEGGELIWHATPSLAVEGRHVVFMDDILDQGVTLTCLKQWALEGGAQSVTTVVLLDKQLTGKSMRADYSALNCPDRYVFGWGMDFEGYWRNLPDIFALPVTERSGSDRTELIEGQSRV